MKESLTLVINGNAVSLHPETATMIAALVDYQIQIHQQGAGAITLDYRTGQGEHHVTFSLSRVNFKVIARQLS